MGAVIPSVTSSEPGQARRAGAPPASVARGRGRANGSASATGESSGPWSWVTDPGGPGTLDALVSDFVRVLGCEVALLGELDGDSGAQVVCASGIARPMAIIVSRRGGVRRPGTHPRRGGCFVGRALTHERPASETFNPDPATTAPSPQHRRVSKWSALAPIDPPAAREQQAQPLRNQSWSGDRLADASAGSGAADSIRRIADYPLRPKQVSTRRHPPALSRDEDREMTANGAS